MKTVKEKVTFVLTAIAYALFHLGKMPDGSILMGTLTALASTLPFEVALTYIIIIFIRRTSGDRPPWDRILRIFFTVGILFGLVYNLYVRGAIEQQKIEQEKPSATQSVSHDSPMIPLHWA